MARFLGPGSSVEDESTGEVYTTAAAPAWEAETGLRPPAYIIGVGGFGVTYRATDSEGRAVALKEYFPRAHSKRNRDGQILPILTDGNDRIFSEGLRRFVAEGQLLAAFDHPNINRVTAAFELDGSAYHISPLVEGLERLGDSDTGSRQVERRVTLEHYFRDIESTQGAVIDFALLRPIFDQLLDAVEYVHTEGTALARDILGEDIQILLHRDIKPSNVLVEPPEALREAPSLEVLRHPDTRVRLIDFGSARVMRDNDDVTRSISVITAGYAPSELQDNDIEQQGAHTDIYSLAAIAWRAFLRRPPSTTQLLSGGKLEQLVSPMLGTDADPHAPRQFLAAIDWGLMQASSARPPSIAAWRKALYEAGGAPDVKKAGAGAGGKIRSYRLPLIAAGVVAALVVGAVLLTMGSKAGVEKHILEQANRAIEDAAAAAAQGEAAAQKGDEAALQAADVGSVATVVEQAEANYAAYEESLTPFEIYHAWNEGNTYYGDLRGGYANATVYWCHPKGPNITPAGSYSNAGYDFMTFSGKAGYFSCGRAHTHKIARQYYGSRSPWKVDSNGGQYLGQVDEQSRPGGLGRLSIGGRSYSGRIGLSGDGYDVVGSAVDGMSRVAGRLQVTRDGALGTWTGTETAGGALRFRGERSGGKTGYFVVNDSRKVFGVLLTDGGVMGRAVLADGGTWTGQPGNSGERTWGRLERAGYSYLGQIADGQPGGCGVRTLADGTRQSGYFTGDGPPSGDGRCRNEVYLTPERATSSPADAAQAGEMSK